MTGPACYHCGLDAKRPIVAVVGGESRAFCCDGCRLAAELISAEGLDLFYQRREGTGLQPGRRDRYPFDDAEFQAGLVTREQDALSVQLGLEGLHCAACVWLIERILARTEGILEARVNLTARKLSVRWEPGTIGLGDIARLLDSLGYPCAPYDPSGNSRRALQQNRALLLRVSLAALGTLGAMFLGDPLNLGGFDVTEETVRRLFAWGSLAIATPTALYVGWPFFRGAWTALRARGLNMDTSITVASLVAYLASAWSIIRGHGSVYFDCLLSLLFLLLVGRTLEGSVRRRVFTQAEGQYRLEAQSATLLEADSERTVPIASLKAGDRVLVRPGERIPVDGLVESGASHVDEAMLSGEAHPVPKDTGSQVTAGSLNLEGALRLCATRVGSETTLAQIARWVSEADATRAPSQRMADRAALVFLPLLFLVAGLTFLVNLAAGWDTAVRNTISVLIVTCPCALGLATPAAIVSAMARGANEGILFKDGEELERLSRLSHLVLDKTGTVTTGQMAVQRVHAATGQQAETVLALAASLESLSEHPLARAIADESRDRKLTRHAVEAFRSMPGKGVAGVVDGRSVAIGTMQWLERELPEELPEPGDEATMVYVAADRQVVGSIEVSDPLRADAASTLSSLKGQGIEVILLSGDRPPIVEAIARKLNISRFVAGVLPDGKRDVVLDLRQPERVVAMLGDGVNDAPALAAADIGIAMGGAAALSARAADIVFLGDRLDQLLRAMDLSRRTIRTIHANFALSALYNAIVIPFAALGYIPPWWAAALMPMSSLLVLGNSLRLARSSCPS